MVFSDSSLSLVVAIVKVVVVLVEVAAVKVVVVLIEGAVKVVVKVVQHISLEIHMCCQLYLAGHQRVTKMQQ